MCTVTAGVVAYVGVGTCTLVAHVTACTNFEAADGSNQNIVIAQATPSTPTIANLPASGIFGSGFTPTVATNGDGVKSVTSITPLVCTVTVGLVAYVGVGSCILVAIVGTGTNYTSAAGSNQVVTVAQATPSAPSISNLPASGIFGDNFTPTVSTSSDGVKSVTSNTPLVCTVTAGVVAYVGVGTCTLVASVATTTNDSGATGSNQSFTVDAVTPTPPADTTGYRLVTAAGQVTCFGGATCLGDLSALQLNKPIVGIVATSSGKGYWLVATDGGIFAIGDAVFYGSTGAFKLNKPIVGMAATSTGMGYWLVASDGGIFAFGDAVFYGSMGAYQLNKPIVGMTPTADGKGYWLVASDGGIFAIGDAVFYGSTGALKLNKPIVGMAATSTGLGYWLVASDGGIFAFGDAVFYGSTGSLALNKPIVGMSATADGKGYWMVATDGGIFNFGDATFLGSNGGQPQTSPTIGIATS